MLSKFKFLHFIFFFFVGVFGVIVLNEALNADLFKWDAAGAQTGNMVSCYKVSLAQNKTETSPVLVSGIPNSGTYKFSEPIDYGACVLKENVENLFVQGWAWNTNLGWVSFLCAGGTNSGIDCGSTPYSVSLNVKTGKFGGYAWGDNIGWISMNCSGGKNGTADCGTVDYGVRVAMADGEDGGNCGTMNKGDLYGYAWTDTVGWMNFCGAHVDLGALEEPIPETPPADSAIPDTDTPTPDAGTPSEDVTAKEPGQAAIIQGNFSMNIVRTDGLPVAILDEDGEEIDRKIGTSLGEQAQSAREKIYRSIAKNIRNSVGTEIGKKPLTSFDPTKVQDMKQVAINNDIYSYLIYYRRDKNKTDNKPCSIILDGLSADLTVGKESFTGSLKHQVTIVSKGCDIFIDNNIRLANEKSRLGVIALGDLSMPTDRRGGNIYVCSRVTDIEASLVADGSIFSYGQQEDKCGGNDKNALIKENGYPNFGTADIKSLFKHQLAIVGALISNNTYGGSVSSENPPVYILGDGSTTTNQDDARLFDMNFLRYSKVDKTKGDKPTDFCWDKNIKLSKYLLHLLFPDKDYWKYLDIVLSKKYWDEICTENNPNKRGIVNVIHQGTTEYTPIFNGQ